MASGGGGYDISNSQSESSTQGLSNKFGAFNVGGGLRIPEWTWPVLIIGLVVLGVAWLTKK